MQLYSEQQQRQENQNDKANVHNEKLQTLTEYDKDMIKVYKNKIEDIDTLKISSDKNLKSLDFVKLLNLHKLRLEHCKNIIPKLESMTIIQLQLMNCDIQSVEDFQLENLEVLYIINLFKVLESKKLLLEIVRYTKLKELHLYSWQINISPLAQLTGLTILRLTKCELHSTEALRPLVNLTELNLDYNKVDITQLQYLTNLTILSLWICNLVSLDALRPLIKLKNLNIQENKVVCLQPLMELKQLSILNARFNNIINSELIYKHPKL
ncbi:leucine-rich_repeat domain-containing protein [Hexamita inflata]|uniref:Leucine-rich repeat domain-containing protein n=1 Tax=Hexamita inflata TaxID=28002 RepID=A0AA86Q222_9EUKA|nr:leucine-rich repeat domain-containing protein [Hexamita inflata]